MRRLIILPIGLAIIIVSYFSDIALSQTEQENWSNYTQTWETKWTFPDTRSQYERLMAENILNDSGSIKENKERVN